MGLEVKRRLIGFILIVAVIVPAGWYGIAHIPPVKADSHPGNNYKPDPLAAGEDVGATRTRHNLDLTGTVHYKGGGTANFDTSGGPTSITLHPGESYSISFNYNVANPTGGTWDSDIYFIGGGSSFCYPIYCLSNPNTTNGGGAELNDNTYGVGNDADPGVQDGHQGAANGYQTGPSCPSYYYNHDSPFAADGTNAGYLAASGSDLPWYSGTLPIGYSSCNDNGSAAIWHGVSMGGSGWQHNSVDYTVDPGASPGTYTVESALFCGSINNAGGCPTHTEGLENPAHPTRTWHADHGGGNIYYWSGGSAVTVNVIPWPPVTISGNVQSDPSYATGKRFANQGNIVSYAPQAKGGACDWAHASQVSTNAAGQFYIGWTEYKPICIQPNGFSWNYDGTSYTNIQPPNTYAPPNNVPGGVYDPPQWTGWNTVQSCDPSQADWNAGTSTCQGYNFYWLPGTTPQISKSVSVGNGTAVKPGDRITYTVTLNNPYDQNYNYGGGASSLSVDDYVPNNIDPTTTGGPGYTFGLTGSPTGSIPAGWSVSSIIPCFSASYGYPASPSSTGVGCSSPNTGLEAVATNILPAYSAITLTWTGFVKSAPNVGVYPEYFATSADSAHATHPNCNSNIGNSRAGIIGGCLDYTNGLQGVYDVAGFLDPSRNWTPSNQTYNPIPAAVACVSKSVATLPKDLANPTTSNQGDCGTVNDYYAYVPGRASYDAGTVNLQVENVASMGPLYYAVYDQTSVTGVNNNLNVLTGTQSPSLNYTGASGPGALVNWGTSSAAPNQEYAAGATSPETYSFGINLDGSTAPLGNAGTFPNTAVVCQTQYWIAGHPLDCSTPSNTVYFTRYQASSPYVTTTNGDVHVGAASATGGFCSPTGVNTNPYTNELYGNNSIIGQYLVSVGNDVSGQWNGQIASGSSSIATAGGVGVIVRPDLCNAAQQQSLKQSGGPLDANTVIPANASFNDNSVSGGNPSGVNGTVDGKVVTANGNFTLGSNNDNTPANVTINNRWTLYVTGNLYIDANVNYNASPPTTSPSNAQSQYPSFGVIVEGNIYIAKNVTHLDGFYVSSQITNTCANASGSSVSYYDSTGTAIPGAYSVADCGQQLTVNGLLFADTFRLNRTYGYLGNTGASEQVNYDNRLYTATPPALSALAASNQLSQYSIEPLPRY